MELETLSDVVAALSGCDATGLVEHDKRGRPREFLSYHQLQLRARARAQVLRSVGIGAGGVVFLQLPNGTELVECFLAVVLTGAKPCCLAPPRALGGLEAYQERIAKLFAAFPGCRLIADEATGSRSGQDYLLPPDPETEPVVGLPVADPQEIAFLQLTSGTSKAPKAVQIAHRALIANTKGILHSGRGQSGDTYVSWLPLYHDMGLVGMLMCALVSRSTLHLFRPESFIARPLAWLQTVAGAGQVVTTAPNFAYQHCVNTVSAQDAAGLDLSAWRVAGCGAERVRTETLDEFAQHFAAAGFRPESFVPCYGMAEVTLAVTFDSRDHAPLLRDGQVSCGRPLPQTEIVVRDADGRALAEGEVGEIVVRSPGLCSGYAGDAAADPSIRDGWLWTGDLGCLVGGELYVTGRKKDLIIIDGHNIDPDEIEAAAEAIVRTPGGRSGAFAVEVERREAVVLIVEVPKDSDALHAQWMDAIGTRVAALFGFALQELVFVARGALPTTSSGKVRRAELKLAYQAGQLG